MGKTGVTMSIEIEKKYRITLELRSQIVESLIELGAEFAGEDFEENIIFSNDVLVEKYAIVRIRKTSSGTKLTFKQRISSESSIKHQIEYETNVEEADAAASILEGIGLVPTIIYEKKRRTYTFRNAEVMLDELPFGSFMEIEGSLTAIAEIEMLLGIEEIEAETETYPKLTSKLGTRNGDLIEARFFQS